MNIIGLQTLVMREIQRFTRVAIQTLVSPWISAVLYIFIFGFVVGSRITDIQGVKYIVFVMPGVLMLNLIASSFSQTSSSIYFGRFTKHIEELLVAPLSNFEMIIGYLIGGVIRGLVVGAGVYLIAIVFGAAAMLHPGLFLLYSLAVSLVFALLGMIVGLWSDGFEQLALVNTFIITPLTFLGGMFNSIEMLPAMMQSIVRWNPFFYFVDGLRYSMTGVQEANPIIGWVVILGLLGGLLAVVVGLFVKGWKIRS